MCRGDNGRVIGQTKVVIGAEVQDLSGASIAADFDPRLLRASDQAFGLEKALGLQGLRALCKGVEKTVGHGLRSRCSKGAKYSKMPFFQTMVLRNAFS
jgi:hypothetical protein